MLFVTDGTVPPNIGGTVTIFPVSRNSTKEYEKNIYTSYIHSVQHQSAPPPPFCAPPSKSFPHFVIVLVVLNQ